ARLSERQPAGGHAPYKVANPCTAAPKECLGTVVSSAETRLSSLHPVMERAPMSQDDGNFGINPAWIYRKTDPETRRILGLKPTQIDEEIAKGNLPPPLELTPAGKAKGWLGETLIQIQRERLARAAAKQAARRR